MTGPPAGRDRAKRHLEPRLATPDPWQRLKPLTAARIALGRAGGSLPTRELLDFQLAHAAARDAVHHELDLAALERQIAALGVPTIPAASAAADRRTYLQRPDLGRRLDAASRSGLAAAAGDFDLVLVVSDGLSALAAHRQALPVLEALLPLIASQGWRLAPVVIVKHARVALQDEIGALVGARCALVLLGERPGLGSPDSLGAYLVYDPRPGRTDADRNCVSNIRPAGLAPAAAAATIQHLVGEALRRKLSGVGLKDERSAWGYLPLAQRQIRTDPF